MRYTSFIIIVILLVTVQACSKPDFDKELRGAEAQMGLGKMNDALKAFESIAKEFPDNPERSGVLLRIAKIRESIDSDPKGAIKAYDDVILQYPLTEEERIARERRAALDMKRGYFVGAIENYSALVKHFGQGANYYRYQVLLGSAYLSSKEYSQARTEIAPLLRDKDTPPVIMEQAMFAYAESLFLSGRIELASKWYKAILEDFPDSELADEARLHLATCYEEMGLLNVAKDITKSAKGYPNPKVIDARLKSIDERGTKPPEKMDLLLPEARGSKK